MEILISNPNQFQLAKIHSSKIERAVEKLAEKQSSNTSFEVEFNKSKKVVCSFSTSQVEGKDIINVTVNSLIED